MLRFSLLHIENGLRMLFCRHGSYNEREVITVLFRDAFSGFSAEFESSWKAMIFLLGLGLLFLFFANRTQSRIWDTIWKVGALITFGVLFLVSAIVVEPVRIFFEAGVKGLYAAYPWLLNGNSQMAIVIGWVAVVVALAVWYILTDKPGSKLKQRHILYGYLIVFVLGGLMIPWVYRASLWVVEFLSNPYQGIVTFFNSLSG